MTTLTAAPSLASSPAARLALAVEKLGEAYHAVADAMAVALPEIGRDHPDHAALFAAEDAVLEATQRVRALLGQTSDEA